MVKGDIFMNELLTPNGIQNRLWGKFCGETTERLDRKGQPIKSGLTKRIDQARSGHLPTGITLAEINGSMQRFEAVLGDFAPRVLIASDPNGTTLIPEQIAVAGGWCAFRTKDVATLTEQGCIMNPETGALEKVTDVSQVAEWIEQAVAFDQAIESVGAVRAREYAVISEQRLWTQRIQAKCSAVLGKSLSSDEESRLEKAVVNAELKRAEITRRYIQYVTNNETVIFQRVVDEDIWDDLKTARNLLLGKAGIPLSRLRGMFPNDPTLSNASLVWAMYSEPYFDMLRSRGTIQSQTVFVVEPSLHAYPETQPEMQVAQRIYQERGIYFDPKGFNANTGFIAYLECVSSRGANARRDLCIGEVPNIANWRRILQAGRVLDADNATNASLNPQDNPLFLWGTNILPVRETQRALLTLTEIQGAYKRAKESVASQFTTGPGKVSPEQRTSIQNAMDDLKREYTIQVMDQNAIIAGELKKLFEFLTK